VHDNGLQFSWSECRVRQRYRNGKDGKLGSLLLARLKGLSNEIDLKNFDQTLKNLTCRTRGKVSFSCPGTSGAP
jgi:hypothetical protein